MKTNSIAFTGTSLTHHMIILVCVLVGSSATAQSWTNRYNGPGNATDWPYGIAIDGSGNVYVTGYSQGVSSDGDYATIKYSSAGVPLWTNRYNGPLNGNDGASAIVVDGSGNVYVTGTTPGTIDQDYDYTTIKYSSAGVPLWTKLYDGPGSNRDVPEAIAVDSSGNVYVTGESANAFPFDLDHLDYATVAYSSTGVPLWTGRYNGPENYRDSPRAIAVDGSGNVYVTGFSKRSSINGNYLTIKYSSAGAPLWTQRYNGPGNAWDEATDIAVDGSGNVYVTGSSTGSGGDHDYATVKYSSAGVPLWTNRYNGPLNGNDGASAIVVDGSGNVYVTGNSAGGNTWPWTEDYATVAYTSAGVPLWTNRYNGTGDGYDHAEAIAVDGSGNVYVTGYSEGDNGRADYLTIAYTSAGVPLWSRRYNGPGDAWDSGDAAKAIAVDASGSVYVTGYSSGSSSDRDYATIKYVPPLVDHFSYNTVQSPQVLDVSFPVTLTAKSLAESNCTFFTGIASFSGYAPGLSATNLSIGTGTTGWGYPLHTSYHDARTQVLYRDSELGMACTLHSLAIEVTTPPGQTLENWTIRMKHTSMSQYSSSPEWEGGGWTVVYQGNEPAGTTGWRTFEFSTPFEYNGSDNLLVDFSFNNASYSTEGQCRSTDMGSYRSITFASDSKDGDPLTWSGISPTPTRSYNVPNVVLGAIYPDLLPVSFSPTVTTPFVNGVWTGEVTVHEAVSNLVLRAYTGEGVEGESNPFDVLAPPATLSLVMHEDPFSFTNGCYGFTVQGSPDQVTVIEASTDLITWLPIHTNLMGDLGECLFYDLHTGQFPRRYYRAKLHEGELAPPAMLKSGSGVVGAQFRVAVGAVGGQQVVVEASTNLVDWAPILTNTAGIGPCYFHDPHMTNYTQRFYRAVTP